MLHCLSLLHFLFSLCLTFRPPCYSIKSNQDEEEEKEEEEEEDEGKEEGRDEEGEETEEVPLPLPVVQSSLPRELTNTTYQISIK